MTAPPPTAVTPEELARTADLRASLDRAYAIASPTGAANHLAAWANNHGKALLDLAEAQRADIERLKEQNADLEKAALTAYENGVEHAFEAAKEEAEAALADLLRLTGQTDAAKAVAVVATMLAGADHGSYGSVVREYAECKAALAAVTAERDRMREALSKAIDAADEVARAKDRLASVRGAADQKRRNMEVWVSRTTVALENALMFARAALQPQEATDER